MADILALLTPAELRAIEEHIRADARWVAWIAHRIRIDGPTARPAALSAAGTLPGHPSEATKRLAAALQDLRRRRMNPSMPHGWPVLSLHQRGTLVRASYAAFRGRLVVEGDEAIEVARLLHCTGELARAEWALAAMEPRGLDAPGLAAHG